MFSHAILRFCTANPDEIQPIGAYSGLQSSVHPYQIKSKTYFHLTFPASPDKSTVHQAKDSSSSRFFSLRNGFYEHNL